MERLHMINTAIALQGSFCYNYCSYPMF